MDWKNWQVKTKGAPQVVICAPSKGVAIEYFMATHGILSTNDLIFCEPTDRPLYGSKESVLGMFHGEIDQDKANELDAHHLDTLGVAPVYAIASNVVNAAYNSFSHGIFRTMQEALDVVDVPALSVLCQVGGEPDSTIIKRYWHVDRGWLSVPNLRIIGANAGQTNVLFGFPGVFELAGHPILPFMRAHDQIIDNGGDGRVVYVHRCAQCGRLFARNTVALVPALCGKCGVGEWAPERKVQL